MSHNTSQLRLCKDCPHARCTPGDDFQFRYWCGISDGDGVRGTALGIRPWYDEVAGLVTRKETNKTT